MTTTTVLRPGDRVLITFEQRISYEQSMEIMTKVRQRFPDVEFSCLVGAESVIVQPATETVPPPPPLQDNPSLAEHYGRKPPSSPSGVSPSQDGSR